MQRLVLLALAACATGASAFVLPAASSMRTVRAEWLV
jgi:hypothetical protein